MTVNRRQFAQGIMALPMTGGVLTRFETPSHIEPPTLLWELLALIPSLGADGEAIRLTGMHGEMIFPGTLRSTPGILPEQVRPILEADTRHTLDVGPIATDEQLARFVGEGVGLERIEAIGALKPCTIYIGDFAVDDVHAAWESLNYVPSDDPDIWFYKGISEGDETGEAADTLLVMQRRLSLPPRSYGRYAFLTLIDNRYIVEAESGSMLRLIREQYANNPEQGSPTTGFLTSLGSVPATIGHVTKVYEEETFVSERRAESGTQRLDLLQSQNEEALASIEGELGRMPKVKTAFLGITPGTPWSTLIDASDLPDIPSVSIANIRLDNEEEAEQYLAIAHARFETLVSIYTEAPYTKLFSFEGRTSGNHVAIDLGHDRTPRYDILQMAYFNDLAFLTWEPDGRETWRSGR